MQYDRLMNVFCILYASLVKKWQHLHLAYKNTVLLYDTNKYSTVYNSVATSTGWIRISNSVIKLFNANVSWSQPINTLVTKLHYVDCLR